MCKFKTNSITKANELIHAAVAVTNRLVIKINETTERKEPMTSRRF